MNRTACVLLGCLLALPACASVTKDAFDDDGAGGGGSNGHRGGSGAPQEPPDAPAAPDAGVTRDGGATDAAAGDGARADGSAGAAGRAPDAARPADAARAVDAPRPPDAARPADAPRGPDGPVELVPRLAISEAFVDPAGADDAMEWIEIYNGSGAAIDLTGWRIRAAGTTYGNIKTLAGTIPARGCQLVMGLTGLQNGSTATDAVALTNPSGTIIDALLYDTPNTNNLADEAGSPGSIDFNSTPTSGHSIERTGRTTWRDQATPTPGDCSAIMR